MFHRVRVALKCETKVPTKPPSNVEEVRNQYDQTLVRRLEEVKSLPLYFTCSAKSVITRKHFRSRPIWTRAALLSQFTPAQAREIHKFVPIHHILRTFFAHARECQLQGPFAVNLLCLWRWPMERHHGSIWLRPAARSTGKIVSMCRSNVSRC
jgi:hypothetical protein